MKLKNRGIIIADKHHSFRHELSVTLFQSNFGIHHGQVRPVSTAEEILRALQKPIEFKNTSWVPEVLICNEDLLGGNEYPLLRTMLFKVIQEEFHNVVVVVLCRLGSTRCTHDAYRVMQHNLYQAGASLCLRQPRHPDNPSRPGGTFTWSDFLMHLSGFDEGLLRR